MADYADTLWTQYRDPATGLFSKDTVGVSKSLEQGAAVQIFAVLGSDRSTWRNIY
jgi:hypothetical protein